VAGLLRRSRFKTIRLGLKSSSEATQIETGGRLTIGVSTSDYHLKRVGYSGEEIGVYIMVGLPGQR